MPPKVIHNLAKTIKQHFKPICWFLASSPHSLAKDAFVSWHLSATESSADRFGHFAHPPHENHSPTGYAMRSSTRTIFLRFADSTKGEAWVKTQASTSKPFEFRRVSDPSKDPMWKEVLPDFSALNDDYGALPQAFVRVSTTEADGIGGWIEALSGHRIQAFRNVEEKSLWIPVRTEADGEAIVSSYFDTGSEEFPGVLAEVIPISNGPNRTLTVTVIGTVAKKEHHLRAMWHLRRVFGLRPNQTKPDAKGTVRIVLEFADTRHAARFLLKVYGVAVETSEVSWAIYKTKVNTSHSPMVLDIESPKRKRDTAPPATPTPVPKRRKVDAIDLSSTPLFAAKQPGSGASIIDLTSPPRRPLQPIEASGTRPPPAPNETNNPGRKSRAEVTAGAADRAKVRRMAKEESKAAKPAGAKPQAKKGGGNTHTQTAQPTPPSSAFGEVKLPLFNQETATPLTQAEEEEAREEVLRYIDQWYNDHNCTIPPADHIKEVLDHLPTSSEALAIFYRARRAKASTMEIAVAFSRIMHHVNLDIEADTPCVYICTVNAMSDKLDAIISRLPNVYGTERIRIKAAMEEVYQDLERAGHGEGYIVSLLYAGYTWLLSGRGRLDVLHYPFDGPPNADKRSPFLLASVLGAGATGISDLGYIVWRNGEAWLHGDLSIIADAQGRFKAFPPITRIPIFPILDMPKHLWHILEPIAISLCCPTALNVQLGGLARHRLDTELVSRFREARIHPKSFQRIIFLGDATGTKGRAFIASETGVIMMVMVSDLTGDLDPRIRLFDYHHLIGHPSNIRVITKSELAQLLSHISDEDLLMWVFGTTVAGENTWRYLFDGSIPKNVPFFVPFIAKVLGRKRIVVLVPHIGVLNHVGHLPWILTAFADFTALSILMGSHEIEWKAQNPKADPEAAEKLLARCQADPVYKFIAARLQGPSLRNLWDGKIARTVQYRLDIGEGWKNLYTSIMAERESEVITTLRMPSDEYEGFEEPILIKAVPDDGTGGHVGRKVTVPDGVTGRVSKVAQLQVPYQYRQVADDIYVFFHIHPTTLHLQMVTRDGEFPRNIATGKIFSIPRVEWMTKKCFAPDACEGHAKAQGFWTNPSDIERRDIDFRKSRKTNGDDGDDCNANLRLVHTFDREKIIAGVANGEPHLHPINECYKFHLYDGKRGFSPFWSKSTKVQAWELKNFKNRMPPEVESVAPFVRESDLAFGFLLFKCSQETDGVHVLVGEWDQFFVPGQRAFAIIHGVGTHLYKEIVAKRSAAMAL